MAPKIIMNLGAGQGQGPQISWGRVGVQSVVEGFTQGVLQHMLSSRSGTGRAPPVIIEEVSTVTEKEDRMRMMVGISTGSMVLSMATLGCIGVKGRTGSSRRDREDMEADLRELKEGVNDLTGKLRRGRGLLQEWESSQFRGGEAQIQPWMVDMVEEMQRVRDIGLRGGMSVVAAAKGGAESRNVGWKAERPRRRRVFEAEDIPS